MNEGLTPFVLWKERALLLAASAALAGYAALWVVGGAVARDEPGPPPEAHRYVRAAALEPFPEGAESVFASAEAADSWDESLPRRWVAPKLETVLKTVESVDLPPPPASVPAPPMLLPLPGPAPEFTADLPRWPAGPAASAGPAAGGAPVEPGLVAVSRKRGAIDPVPFQAVPYDTVVMRATGEEIKGILLSAPDAPQIKIRRTVNGVGTVAQPLSQVREIRPRLTLEQAHDKVASTIDPTDHVAWHGLAIECLNKRPPLVAKAIVDLEKALTAAPRHLPSQMLLARCYLRLGSPAEARKVAEKAAAADPQSDEVRLMTGFVLAALGEDPRPEFRMAIAKRPSVEAHLALAEAELDFGGYDAAGAAVAAAAEIDPTSADVQVARGDVLLAKGEAPGAEAAYARALPAVGAGFGAEVDACRLGLSAVQYLQGRLDEADKTLLRADVSNPRVAYLQGLVRLARGGDDAAKARDRFLRAAEAGCGRAHLGLGTHLYHHLGGDAAAARAEFRKAVDVAPRDAHVLELAAWCEYRTGETDRAAETYARMTKLAPRYAAGHAAAAAVALEAKRHAEAVRGCRTGLESCPGSGQILAALGLAQIAAGDLGAAGTSLEQSLAAGFKGPDVYLGLGYLANGRKDLAAAARRFTSALAGASAGGAPGAALYAQGALTQVMDARGLKLTALGFEGGPGLPPALRPDARFGPAATVDSGELVIAGKQAKIDDGRTRASANADAGVFRSVAADVRVAGGSPATAGVFVESMNGSVELARTPVGSAAFRVKDGRDAAWGGWQTLVAWPADGCMRLEIVMLDAQMNLARLEVRASRPLEGAGETAAARIVELKNALWRERALGVGAFAGSTIGSEVGARFDNMFLVDRKASAAP